MLRHVVLFQWKPETPPEEVAGFVRAFSGLPGKIGEIRDFEWGTDASIQGMSNGFTHCFVVSVASESDRDAYLTHPDHLEFIALTRPHVQQLLTFDYVVTDAGGAPA